MQLARQPRSSAEGAQIDAQMEALMDAHADLPEYDIRHQGSGWTVYNTKTSEPVRLNDAAQVGLSREVAKEILQMLRMFQPGLGMDGEG